MKVKHSRFSVGVILDQRIFQVGNPIIYQAYCVPLLYESRTVTPCHPPGCAYR